MRRYIDKLPTAFGLAVVFWLAGPALRLVAQPQEIREGTSGDHLTFYQAIRAFRTLNTSIDRSAFTEDTTVKKAIAELYEELAKKKLQSSWTVMVFPDAGAKHRPGFDFYNARIKLSRLPKHVTPAILLREIFAQTDCTDLVVAIWPGGNDFTIAPQSRIDREQRIPFFWFTRIAFVLEQ